MNLPSYKKAGAFGLFALLIYILFKGHGDNADLNNKAMQLHCDVINSDITRPLLRKCIKPISFKDGLFTFQIENSDIEVYRIVKAAKNDTVDNYYIFESSRKTH